ncbi:cytochrome P450 [Mycena capillaripes]|nr:cytochrome P450 [Mycena capillaripes]KAJ6533013.1 cytochrome P450 [Mycena capillaripes]KAJ6533186.1 cytochrome P450 [Mycena capillaripes]KAJ6533207.1 cytochrome P450 [Mycena capillaripes]
MFLETADYRIVAAAAFALLAWFSMFRKKRLTPPGPPGWPLIGNMFDVPRKESWKVYLEWSNRYHSDIVSMKVAGTQFLILNSAKAIQDLLIKRSNIYSDRPHSTMIIDLMKTTWLIVFMNNNDRWKIHRHLFKREFDSPEASVVNKKHAVQASRRLINRLLTSKDHEGELRLAAVDSILSITYGITPTDFEHPFIKVTGEVNEIFADVARGTYLVDAFPFLKNFPRWLPGLKFLEIGDRGRGLARDVVLGPYNEIQSQVDKGTAVPSVASRFLSSLQDGEKMQPGEVDAMRNVLANAYLAGSDTSICVLYNFVLAMALHPEVQKKAQKSLDDVLRGERLPNFADFERTPYLAAVVNEVFRWHPVTPFAVYHVSTQDDSYNNYHIPKGSIIVPNAWAMLRDENLFGPDTHKFIPERFVRPDGTINYDLSAVDMAFGYGRRACPGRVIARDTVWIMAASMLAAYDIVDPVDLDGNKLTADTPLEYTNAMVSFAPHFKVSFKRRIPESMIHEAVPNE